MKPRLLVISGTFLATSGGAEISALSLLKRLRRDWDIDVLSCNFRGRHLEVIQDGIRISAVPYAEFEAKAARAIDEIRPRLIYTLMLGSDVAMRLGAEKGIPTIVNVCKVPVGPVYFKNHPPTQVFAVSTFVSDYLRTQHQIHATVVNPIVEFESLLLPASPRFITIFNPVKAKGGLLFRELAQRMPRHEFAWVPGWDILRAEDGRFDPVVCAAICRSIGIRFSGGTPDEIALQLPNVHQLRPAFPPHPIFQQTRILIVPSQWDEAFGRVAAEGMLFGVPVLAADVGGLAELGRTGGSCLPKGNVAAWEAEIRKLDDPHYYSEVCARGRAWRERWLSRDHDDVCALFRTFR